MATAKTATPGPKPDFLVVEDHLKCQTNEGEKSLDLRIPLERIELFMNLEELKIPQSKMPRFIIDNILWPEDKATIEGMRDGAKALKILVRYSEVLGERMGAEMGESKGSTVSSESTVEPSATTSDTDSE
ncbi:hypothetical protein [Glaciibacter superstes]|uniref:hypothetical protein n=1 Tax=Glaciibacter superstes TaxID=501023 RepID=UPI0003B355D2|nr:hypothetical protein [Glaciibacter superstes]